jgi:Na+-driven multidrug efflux pump
MLSTVSALGAQNVGAGRRDRARGTLRVTLCIAVGWGLLIAATMLLAAEPFISLFTKDPAVIRTGVPYMRGYVWDVTLAGMHFCFSGYFCAVGRSELSFLHNAVAIVLARIPLAYLASARFPATLFPMGLATSFGSLLSVAVCLILYTRLEARQNAVPAEEGGTTAE